jgi:hypothetical protein
VIVAALLGRFVCVCVTTSSSSVVKGAVNGMYEELRVWCNALTDSE